MKRIILCIICSVNLIALVSCGNTTKAIANQENSSIKYDDVTNDTLSTVVENESEAVDVDEQVEKEIISHIELTDDDRYSMNLFLSNFAEQFNSESVDVDINNNPDINWICDMAFLYAKINTSYQFEEKEFPNKEYYYYFEFPIDKLNVITDRFFGTKYSTSDLEVYSDSDLSFSESGSLYYVAADGESYNKLAIISSVSFNSDSDVFLVCFDIYELDIEQYWNDDGVNKIFYQYDTQQAENDSKLKRVTDGYAEITPIVYNDKDTYRLIKYTVNADEDISNETNEAPEVPFDVCGTYYYYSASYTDEYDETTNTSPEHIEPDTRKLVEISQKGSDYYIKESWLFGNGTFEPIYLMNTWEIEGKKCLNFYFSWTNPDESATDCSVTISEDCLTFASAHSSIKCMKMQ